MFRIALLKVVTLNMPYGSYAWP